MTPAIRIEQLVPGGVMPTDHIHVWMNDGTCSRCRSMVPDDEVPLIFFLRGGSDMLIYCTDCCAGPNND